MKFEEEQNYGKVMKGYLQFLLQVCGFLELAEKPFQDKKLAGRQSEQQVADLPQKILERSAIHHEMKCRREVSNLSYLKSSGKSAVSLSTLRGPVGKTTKPQTIARRGMANIRLQIYLLTRSNIWGKIWISKSQHNILDSISISLFGNMIGILEKYN